MQGSGKVGVARTAEGMTEWGKKARKAEARTKKNRTRRAAIRDSIVNG